jgi:hypothetical protein
MHAGYQMERLMKTHQIECGAFDTKGRRLRSLLSAQISHRIAASVIVLAVAFVAVAATTAGRHAPGNTYGAGSNWMLLPGQPGFAPALY